MVMFRVGKYGCPIRFRSDGVMLSGIRRFTPQELTRYTKNMYGNNCFRRWSTKMMKQRPYEQMVDAARVMRETADDKYGVHWRKDNPKLINALAKARVVLKEWQKAHPDETKRQREDAWAKAAEALRSGKGDISKRKHYYFIDDIEIEGYKFKRLDYIKASHPLFQKLYDMSAVLSWYYLDYDERREIDRARCQKWRKNNPERAKEHNRCWRENNADKVELYNRQRRERYANKS